MNLCCKARIGKGKPIPCVMLIVLLIFAISGFARQSGSAGQSASASVSGKVTAASGQNGTNNLAGITLKLTAVAAGSASRTTVTDFEGRFELTHLTAGSYTLEAVVEGFQPQTATILLESGQALTKDIALQINSVEESIEVQAETTEIATQSVSASATVNEQQLEVLPLRTEKFTEALAISPSVIRTQEGKLNFNGQAESQGMLLVDSAENVDPVSGSFSIPIPVNVIQNMQVFSTPDSSAYGGFSGGLTKIDIRPPGPAWNYKLLDIVPSFRGKNDHLIGLLNMTPGVEFGGPLIKDKLNFSETMAYEFRKDPVHGLTWPWNETVTYSLVSFTEFQWTFSPKHLLNVNFNVFPSTILYANINTFIPQSASASIRRRGASMGISDAYQFNSGAVLTTLVRVTNFFNYQHGQGSLDMTIGPDGWGGDYFNTFSRNANQLEALPILQMPTISWHGSHQIQFGMDALYRSFTGNSASRTIDLLPANCTLALLQATQCMATEVINFLPVPPGGNLQGGDTEVSEYAEERWSLVKGLAFTFGGRLTQQSVGRNIAFAPRSGPCLLHPRRQDGRSRRRGLNLWTRAAAGHGF